MGRICLFINRNLMVDNRLNFSSLIENLFVLCLFLTASPYFLWNSLIPQFIVLLCGVISFLHIRTKHSASNYIIILSVTFFYIYCLYRVPTLSFIGKLYRLMPVFLFWASPLFLRNTFRKFSILFSILLIPSLFTYFLVIIVQCDLNYSIISPLNSIKEYDYLQYSFLVVSRVSDFVYYRFCGYFDEPGVIGTFTAILLIVNKFNMKDWNNWPLFLAGIFSFSLFFYLICLTYALFLFKLKALLIFGLIVTVVFFVFANNEVVQMLVLSRFEISDGHFRGDNRTIASFDVWFADFSSSSSVFWGKGGGTAATINSGGASYKDLIVDYGIIMFVFYLISITTFLYYHLCNKKEFFILASLFLMLIYQRPFVFDYIYVYIYIAPIFYLKSVEYNISSKI